MIIDELGRGTATHDGVAIACATLSHLVCHTQCLSLFVTHYPEVAALATSSSQQQSPAETPLPAPAAVGSGPDGASNQAAGQASPARGRADAAVCSSEGLRGAASSTSSHIAVSHMSYVRHDTRPQQAAAEAATTAEAGTVTGAGSSVGAAAAGSSEAGQTSAAPAEAIPVITFMYKLVEGAADESFGLNVAQVRMEQGADMTAAALAAVEWVVRCGCQSPLLLRQGRIGRVREHDAALSHLLAGAVRCACCVGMSLHGCRCLVCFACRWRDCRRLWSRGQQWWPGSSRSGWVRSSSSPQRGKSSTAHSNRQMRRRCCR